jgi:hypothetical protein
MGASLAAAALLLVTGPLHAQQLSVGQSYAVRQFSEDMMTCFTFYNWVGRCFSGPENKDVPANLEVSKLYFASAKSLLPVILIAAKTGGMSQEAIDADIQMMTKNFGKLIKWDCANLVILVNKYGEQCKELSEHPADRLNMLLQKNP